VFKVPRTFLIWGGKAGVPEDDAATAAWETQLARVLDAGCVARRASPPVTVSSH